MNKRFIFTRTNIILEILGYVFCLGALIAAVVGVVTVDKLPTNYDAAGNVTRYGSPAILFVMPLAMLFANGLMSLCMHLMNPASWNMPFAVKQGREIAVYRDMVRMVMILEFLCGSYSFGFNLLMWKSLGGGILPVTVFFVAAVSLDIIVMLVVAARHNRI